MIVAGGKPPPEAVNQRRNMRQMPSENQESRVIPLSTKLTPSEDALVRRVADAEGIDRAELVRRRVLPWARKRDGNRAA
jgi:hypothetical protein